MEKTLCLDDVLDFCALIDAYKSLKDLLKEKYSLENAVFFVAYVLKHHSEIVVDIVVKENGTMSLVFKSKETKLLIAVCDLEKIVKNAFPWNSFEEKIKWDIRLG